MGNDFVESPSGWFRESLVDGVRFWEPRRLVYNSLLGLVVAAWLVLTWPHFRPILSLDSLWKFAVLALLANVCYSTAYLVDIPMQRFSLSTFWRRQRWGLWLLGTLFALVLANHWIVDEIYPFVH